MSIVWLGLGSNQNAESHIRSAIEQLRKQFLVGMKKSRASLMRFFS